MDSIEQLLARAAADPEFATALRNDRQLALATANIRPTPTAMRLLRSIDDQRLEQLIAGVRRAATPDPTRRALVGGAAAALVGALTGGCQSDGPGPPTTYHRQVQGGGGGGGWGTITGSRPGDGVGYGRPRRKRWLRVRQTKLSVKGGLGREIVRRILRRHINEPKYCYMSKVGDDPQEKPVEATLEFVIAPTGRVASVTLSTCSIDSKPFTRCLVQAVGRWLFPKSRTGKPAQVTYGLSFEIVDPKKKKRKKKTKRRR